MACSTCGCPTPARNSWVNNDIDRTITVIDTAALAVIKTILLPADLVADGGKPQNIVLDPDAPFAFVTMLGLSGASDFMIKYDAVTFQEVARQAGGKDPQVSLARQSDLLYVPTQNANQVAVLNRDTLTLATTIPVMSAYGVGMARDGKVFNTTNVAGGGTDG